MKPITKPSTRLVAALAAGLMFWLLSIVAPAHAGTLPGPLDDVAWLHDHAGQVEIVDVRDGINSLTADPKFEQREGHKVLVQVGGYIPGALSVNFWAIRQTRKVDGRTIKFLMPDADEFTAVMRASVLESDRPMVIVPTGDDASSLQEAAYLAFELQLFGAPADQIALLNGGTHAWIAAGYPVDTDAIAPMESGHWTAQAPQLDMLATTQQIGDRLQRGTGAALFDARPLAQYVGLEESVVATRPGRIPGAKPIPPDLLYRTASDGSARFLSPSHYRTIVKLMSVPKQQPMIVYCNTGQYAASVWFILERLLGDSEVRVYPGSINEWSHLDKPMAALP
ncbi:putative thiosulfate sulfurtransferase SseA [mine drainage metagenome]|uniref:Putative thiosulfate sulfurtransferase SseA n=1 Tax=mine drainage metagenome TaxID=410659 RepID=A0A1J5PWY0_9ZZZZ